MEIVIVEKMNDNNVITSEDERIASVLHALKKCAKDVDKAHGRVSSAARRRTVYDRQRGYRPAESQPTHLAGVSYRTQDTLYRVRRQSPLSGIRHREDARGKLPQGNPLKTITGRCRSLPVSLFVRFNSEARPYTE